MRHQLEGLRVLDLTIWRPGPYASQLLAEQGADVLKVEPPGGDPMRSMPDLFDILGAGKRSIVLDLKDEADRETTAKLAKDADVVIENFRPGVAAKLGIDYETLSAENPELVYCSVTGFDPNGPYRDRPAFDLILQGMAGVMSRQGGEAGPELLVVTIADTFAASLATQGILAALYERERSGIGQVVQANLFQGCLYAQAYRMVTSAEEIEISAQGDVAPYGAYEAADGWFTLAVATDRNFVRLCRALERPDLAKEERFASNPSRVEHMAALNAELGEEFRAQPAAHWIELLSAQGVPCGPVMDVEDLFSDPHLIETEGIVEMDHPSAGAIWMLGTPFSLSRTPLRIGNVAPALGEHTAEIKASVAGKDRP